MFFYGECNVILRACANSEYQATLRGGSGLGTRLIPGLMGRCNVPMVQEVGGIQATYTDEAFSGLQEQASLLDYFC